MCDGIAEYLLKLAEFPPAPKGALKKDVEEPRAKLAEMVALAFWPGPTADVDIISTPDGVPGQTIRFNYTRSGSTNLVFLPAIWIISQTFSFIEIHSNFSQLLLPFCRLEAAHEYLEIRWDWVLQKLKDSKDKKRRLQNPPPEFVFATARDDPDNKEPEAGEGEPVGFGEGKKFFDYINRHVSCMN